METRSTMIPPGKDQTLNQKTKVRWKLFSKIFFLAACLILVALGLLVGNPGVSPFENDPNFVKTTRPTTSFTSPGHSLRAQLYLRYYDWQRIHHPNPLGYTFSASPSPARCSIQGLLNECMDVGGTQYLIEKNVASGGVMFGPTNVLNGQQWVKAFERSLHSGEAEWWDPEIKGFRKERLALIRYDSQTTLVLSKKGAAEFRKRYPNLKW